MRLPESSSADLCRDAHHSRAIEVAIGAVLIVLATLVVYGPAMHGDVLWDDNVYVSENPLLFAEDGLWRIWTRPSESPQYYPLVFTSFWLEARLWGLSTFGLHLVNVVLHAVNALLLWSVLRRLRVPGAWLAGACFALHPVNVESVAWITERKNVLSGMFYLLSILAYLRFLARRWWPLYGLALLWFICALLSKTVTCSLPAVLLLLQWWKRPRIWRQEGLLLLPFFGVGALFGVTTVVLEKYAVGAIGEEWALSWVGRGLLAGRALWFYVGKLLWPADLAFNYPRWQIDATVWWQYAYPGLVIVAGALLWWFRARIGRRPLAALGCFVVGIAPALGLFNIYYFRYSYVADHFQYHASMAFIALLAALVTRGLDRLAGGRGGFLAQLPRVAWLLPFVYGGLAFHQAGLYTDVKTLWRRTIAQNPSSWLARYSLALLLVQDNERDDRAAREARHHLHEVLAINPGCADAYVHLGIIAGRRGQHDEAMKHYRAALRIAPASPRAHYNMGRELYRAGDVAGAISSYRDCLEHAPSSPPAHNGLGRIFLERGEPQRAWEHFQAALTADPRSSVAWHNLGTILEEQGRYREALAHYGRGLSINPGRADSWFRTGVCLRKSGDVAGAEAAFRKTLELNPAHADAAAELGATAYESGRYEDAAEWYHRAVELNPRHGGWRHNLSWAYQELRRYADAAAVLEAGLAVQPGNAALMRDLAHLLATCPDSSVRDGARAVGLARQAVERAEPPRPEAWETLALAYAEVQAYDRAAESAQRALDLARSLGLTGLEEELRKRLEAYEARRQRTSNVP